MTVTNTPRLLKTEAELRELIPSPGKALKKIPALERQSLNFISHAPFLVTTMQRSDGVIELRAYGGQPGFVQVQADNSFLIPLPHGLPHGREGYAGCLFLIPGVNETLRVNGRIKFGEAAELADAEAGHKPESMAVDEVYMHCAKALIRSKLWKTEDLAGHEFELKPRSASRLDAITRDFIEKSPFLLLGTNMPDSGADVAPRGDPAGRFVQVLDDQTLLIPDRKGNHIADNMTNIIANPWAGVLFLVPGIEAELWVSGEAHITTEPELLARLTEQNKTPLVGIVLRIKELELRPSPALAASQLWHPATRIDRKQFPTLGEIFRDQLDSVIPKEVSAEEMDENLARDSKNNLY